MKFDTIIIGGGLAGYSCGIRLQKAGRKCAVISTGESSLYFSSGTMGLLDAEDPVGELDNLGPEHPYSKIGRERFVEYASQIQSFFSEAGISLEGSPLGCRWRMSPTGNMVRCWMAMEGVTSFGEEKPYLGAKVLIVNFLGFLDFNTAFIAETLERSGSACTVEAVKLEEFERLRHSATELLSTTIARALDREDTITSLINAVKPLAEGYDTVVLPAVFGLSREGTSGKVARGIGVDTVFIGTMPPSVPGIRTQMQLSKSFQALGGRIFQGDTVIAGNWEGEALRSVRTANIDDMDIKADNFVLASGSFFSKGLAATPYAILEPALGLDVDFSGDRNGWYDLKFFNRQNYIGFGVRTGRDFRAFRSGVECSNVYAAGSVLSGANSLAEGCGAGTAVMTALAVADNILKEE